MNILFIGFVWPELKSSAASQNIVSYLKYCSNHDHKIWFCSSAQTTIKSTDLTQFNVNSFVCELNSHTFNDTLRKIKPDIVIFDRFLSFEQYASRVKTENPEALLVLDAEDLHFLRLARQQLNKTKFLNQTNYQSSDSVLNVENRHLLYNDIFVREMACIYQADLSIVLSTFEDELLRQFFALKETQVAHIPLQAPFNELKPKLDFDARKDLVFIGNFRHAPNYSTVEHLRFKIWPKLRKKFKLHQLDVNCQIYGAYTSKKVQTLESKSLGFYINGFADCQFKVLSEARLLVAPITFGAGVKGKLIDAMMVNTPSVTTPLGIEGITDLNWSGVNAGSEEEFIESCFELYTSRTHWTIASEQSQVVVEKQCRTKDIETKFIKTLEMAHKNKALNRSNNYLQKIFSHHHLQSSHYMTQWIEAKNKLR